MSVTVGVEVFDGVNVMVGVFVMVGVGVRVSGMNGVTVGLKVGVELGIGEGNATVPDMSGCPTDAATKGALVADGLPGINEVMGSRLASSKKLSKAAALEEYAEAAKMIPLIVSSNAILMNPARVSAILRLRFFETI